MGSAGLCCSVEERTGSGGTGGTGGTPASTAGAGNRFAALSRLTGGRDDPVFARRLPNRNLDDACAEDIAERAGEDGRDDGAAVGAVLAPAPELVVGLGGGDMGMGGAVTAADEAGRSLDALPGATARASSSAPGRCDGATEGGIEGGSDASLVGLGPSARLAEVSEG